MNGWENIALDRIFEIKILIDFKLLRAFIYENYSFSDWFVFVGVFFSFITITPEQLYQKLQMGYSTFV